MTPIALTRLVRTRADGPLPGDACPRKDCNGKIGVSTTRRIGSSWCLRYLHCKQCGHVPENHKWLTAEEDSAS